jgi:predicted ATP-binding protein involved in virulence
MSSGQKQWLNCLSYICYHAKNIESVKNDNTRIPYHHLNLIFDEAELYYHPEFQKSFVKRLLDGIANCHLDKNEIKSINILIATHSPFILSDVLTQNSLYLKKGRVASVECQTFGANYYDLLHNSFFLEDRAIGDIAAKRIGEWVDRMRNNEDIDRLMPYVGDPMVKSFNDYMKEKR